MSVARRDLTLLHRLATAALVLNVVLVVSGGAVRLTGAGLGCPSWPRCTDASWVSTPALGMHGSIEFGNRLVGVALELVGLALIVAVLRARPRVPNSWRWLALVQTLVVPAQAAIGGILVLTEINPYVRTLHFLVSFPIMLAAAALLRRTRDGTSTRTVLVPPRARWLTTGLLAVASAVVLLGTVVTGTGPHAGDPQAARLPLDPETLTQVHADLVYLLLGLAAATAVLARMVRAPRRVRRGIAMTLALLLAQGVVGYVQYYTGVPPILVGLHMLGAALLFTAVAWVHLSTTGPAHPPGEQPPRNPLPSPTTAEAVSRAR